MLEWSTKIIEINIVRMITLFTIWNTSCEISQFMIRDPRIIKENSLIWLKFIQINVDEKLSICNNLQEINQDIDFKNFIPNERIKINQICEKDWNIIKDQIYTKNKDKKNSFIFSVSISANSLYELIQINNHPKNAQIPELIHNNCANKEQIIAIINHVIYIKYLLSFVYIISNIFIKRNLDEKRIIKNNKATDQIVFNNSFSNNI